MGRNGTQSYNNANSSANSNFSSSRQAGSTKQSCPLAQQRTKPCDVKSITLTVVVASKAKTYKTEHGKLEEVADPEADKKPYVVTVAKSDLPDDRLEVLADRKGNNAPTTINGAVVMSYTHDGAEHPEVTITGPDSNSTNKGSKALNFKLPVYRGRYGVDESTAKGKAVAFTFDRIWPVNAAPQTYQIAVDSCGVRTSGKVFKGRTIEVVAYPVDQLGFTLTVPPFSKRTYSHEATLKVLNKDSQEYTTTTQTRTDGIETAGESHTQSYTSATKDGQSSYQGSESIETGGKKLTESISNESTSLQLEEDTAEVPDESKIELKLMRNGKEDQSTLAVRSVVDSLQNLQKTFLEFWEGLDKIVPQVGWKFDFNISFFAGSLACTWGYRQKDARVFFGWSVEADIKIVEAAGSLSFGVDLGNWLVAKLTGTLSGEVHLKGKIEKSSAKGGTSEELSVPGSIKVELTGDAAVGYGWVRFERQAGANLELEVTAKIDFEHAKSPSISAKGELKPFMVWYLRKSWFASDSKSQLQLSDEHTLFDTSFPESKK